MDVDEMASIVVNLSNAPRPDTAIIPETTMRWLARLSVAAGEDFYEPYVTEARAYLTRKQERRERMARKKRRGYF